MFPGRFHQPLFRRAVGGYHRHAIANVRIRKPHLADRALDLPFGIRIELQHERMMSGGFGDAQHRDDAYQQCGRKIYSHTKLLLLADHFTS
jgi:hypothetical protein